MLILHAAILSVSAEGASRITLVVVAHEVLGKPGPTILNVDADADDAEQLTGEIEIVAVGLPQSEVGRVAERGTYKALHKLYRAGSLVPHLLVDLLEGGQRLAVLVAHILPVIVVGNADIVGNVMKLLSGPLHRDRMTERAGGKLAVESQGAGSQAPALFVDDLQQPLLELGDARRSRYRTGLDTRRVCIGGKTSRSYGCQDCEGTYEGAERLQIHSPCNMTL